MSRMFVLFAVICFLMAFVGTAGNLNEGVIYAKASWNSLIALGLFFAYAASFV